MSNLLVLLPATTAGPATAFDYALADAADAVLRQGSGQPATLPKPEGAGAQVVAVVPASALSWHRVDLPKGTSTGSPRLRAVLEGLLEDRLLDEPEQLHFALQPGVSAGAPAWVAICDKAWLRASLQVLEAAQRPAARIVPELWPQEDTSLYFSGDAHSPVLTACGPAGVLSLPLSAAALALVPGHDRATRHLAQPAVVEPAERALDRRVTVQSAAQRWVEASRGPWDLAQFDLASSGGRRAAKRLAGHWADFLLAPRWRPARWALLALLGLNLVALNAAAWKAQSALQAQRTAINAVLTQTFPQVKLVVDAPLQMEKEVALLRQATGASSARDLEAMLSALGSVAPEAVLSSLDYTPGELRVRSKALGVDGSTPFVANLRGRGYTATVQGEQWTLVTERAR